MPDPDATDRSTPVSPRSATPSATDQGHGQERSESYVCPPDIGEEWARWDGYKCPKCGAKSLVAWIEGVAYRYCSYVSCDWGIDQDVIVTPTEEQGTPT